MEKIKKYNNYIAILIFASIIYFRCVFGATMSYAVILNLVVDLIGAVYCFFLFVQNKTSIKKCLCNQMTIWLIIFLLLEFIYGHFGFVKETTYYSIQFTILTVGPALLCYFIMFFSEDLLGLLAKAGSIVILATFITNLKYDYLWEYALKGEFYRLGTVPGGSVIDTGNLYLLMLIPIMYEIIIEKKLGIYIFPTLIGAIGILLTGSKSSAIPLILCIGIMILGAANNKETRKRYIIIFGVFTMCLLFAVMKIPMLYDILGYRLEEVISGFGTDNYDLHTSTGQRRAVLAAFKNHFWEKPILGHGFYAFKDMPYSQLEEYIENGVVQYRNIQTHMNYLELLFSFGIIGLALYYWYPIKLTIFSLLNKNKTKSILCLSFLCAMFFMDLGLDMFYKYMTPYYTYFLVSCLLNRRENDFEK